MKIANTVTVHVTDEIQVLQGIVRWKRYAAIYAADVRVFKPMLEKDLVVQSLVITPTMKSPTSMDPIIVVFKKSPSVLATENSSDTNLFVKKKPKSQKTTCARQRASASIGEVLNNDGK